MTAAAKTLSISIHCTSSKLYNFVSNPQNLPLWATAFCRSARKTDTGWLIETNTGPMGLRFAEPNPFGILDHTVTVSPGVEVYVPMRVIANGSSACEVLFTLFRQPGMSDDEFARDIGMVERDLQTLRQRLES